MSGMAVTQQTISQDGRRVKLYIMKPEHVSGRPGVPLFIHGGVWLVGNFENHQRLLRDLVVGSGADRRLRRIYSVARSKISDPA